MKTASAFIEQEIPLTDRAVLPRQLSAAYEAVSQLVDTHPFLQCPPARFARGHLIAWAVDFAVVQLIECGKWKVEGYEWASFNRPTGKYLRVFTKQAVLTVSQLPDASQAPRQAEFRDNGCYDPQSKFAFVAEDENLASVRRKHLVLVHGHHQLDFLHIGMPNPERSPAWLGITRNILSEVHDASIDLAPTEGPAVLPILTIKDHITKKLRDKHG